MQNVLEFGPRALDGRSIIADPRSFNHANFYSELNLKINIERVPLDLLVLVLV